MLKIGSTGIKSVYVGRQKIKKAYVGEELVYNSGVEYTELDYIDLSTGLALMNWKLYEMATVAAHIVVDRSAVIPLMYSQPTSNILYGAITASSNTINVYLNGKNYSANAVVNMLNRTIKIQSANYQHLSTPSDHIGIFFEYWDDVSDSWKSVFSTGDGWSVPYSFKDETQYYQIGGTNSNTRLKCIRTKKEYSEPWNEYVPVMKREHDGSEILGMYCKEIDDFIITQNSIAGPEVQLNL